MYSNKFSGRGLNLEVFMSILKREYESENYLANLNNKFATFFRKQVCYTLIMNAINR